MEFTFSKGKTHITVDEIDSTLDSFEKIPNYVHKYGFDIKGNVITAPDGYEIITEYCKIENDFIHFDIYSGWSRANYDYHINGGRSICMGRGGYSDAIGRWVCWARPIKKNTTSDNIESLPNFAGSHNSSVLSDLLYDEDSKGCWSYVCKDNKMVINKGENISWAEVLEIINKKIKQ